MSRNRLLLVLAIAMSTAILFPAVGGWSAPMMIGAPSPAHSIVGTWVEGLLGVPGRAAGFPNLVTFTADGSFIIFSTTPSHKGGMGVWVRTGERTFTLSAINLYRNANDEYIGHSEAVVNYTLNATFDEWTGSGHVKRFDAQGNPVRSFDIATHATRLKAGAP